MNKTITNLIGILILLISVGCATTYNRAHYLEVLKSYPEYEHEPTENFPNFTYADSSDENLVKLKETFKLEKVAGNGDEMSKIINLMKWVHNIVKHDGSSKNPSPKNAFNIIKICQEENRGVNCRMIATILNEAYLSMGFKSRFVTCMPEKKDFKDCHVIDIVYSTALDKWIYMDPTFEAYFTDENGNYLSIQEVRERLIRNKPLVLNYGINLRLSKFLYRFLNWIKKYSKKDYISYMSKNLFRLSSPIRSEFNCETKGKDRSYVELVPKNYNMKSNPKIETYNGNKIITYYISNPDFFWANPFDTLNSN